MTPENVRIILRDLGPLVSRQAKEADLAVKPEGLCFIFYIRFRYPGILSFDTLEKLYAHVGESCPQFEFEAVISLGVHSHKPIQ